MKKTFGIIIAAALLGTLATSASAMQRDPAYQSARTDGLIGEQPDGYLGFVIPPSAAIKALVNDLNIKRKEVYTREAKANSATVAEMALRTGCRLISERTSPGEKYKTPAGEWVTRTSEPPILDPLCP